MNRFPSLRNTTSWLLAGLLLCSMSFQAVHHVAGHEPAMHCEANGAEQHFHGPEYAVSECPICHLSFSEQQLVRSIPSFPTVAIVIPRVIGIDPEPYSAPALRLRSTRAPPRA